MLNSPYSFSTPDDVKLGADNRVESAAAEHAPRSEFIAIVYPDAARADEVLKTLGQLRSEGYIDLEDAVAAIKQKDGKVKLHQSQHPGRRAAASGSLVGVLVGSLLLTPIGGAAIGAAAGALAGKHTDVGIEDDFVKELAAQLQPGTSAVFLLVRQVTPEQVLPAVSKFGGTVLQTSLAPRTAEMLQASLAGEQAPTSPDSASPNT